MKLSKFAIVAMACACLSMTACGKSNPTGEADTLPTDVVAITEAPTATEAPTVNTAEEQPVLEKAGMLRSITTGEWVDEEVAKRRPFCIMINNIEDAIPQSGIDHAEIIYEAYVESQITRLMIVMQNYDGLEKIGPVRSCREFYVYYAYEFGGIYTHFGFSPLAASLLDRVEHIDGMKLDGSDFYRTTDRVAPHNAYTSTKGLLNAASRYNFDLDLDDDVETTFQFTQYDTKEIEFENGMDCTLFKPGYVRNKPEFRYNESDGLYYRWQYGEKHVDKESGEQLAFKNIIVRFVTGDKYSNGTPLLNNQGEGEGYYITNGKLSPIHWIKTDELGPVKYTYSDGSDVILNQGKTFVNIINVDDLEDVYFE